MSDSSVIFRILAEDKTGEGLKKTQEHLKETEKSVKSTNEAFKAIAEAAVVEKGFDFLKDAVLDASQAQKVLNLTAGAIASTGGAAGVSAEEVRGLAEKLAMLDGVAPTVTQNASNMLLTFTNIRNVGTDKVFDEATQAALNMSAALTSGNTTLESAQQAARVLGRALNDPVGSLGALSRMGVQFTNQQKEQIKQLVASGNGIKAQGLILDQVKAKFGNAGAAMATPFQKLQASVETAKEDIGMQLMPTITGAINAALPVVLKLSHAFGSFLAFVQQHGNVFGPVAAGIAAVVLGLRAAAAAQAMWDALTAANPIVLALAAIAGIVIALAVKFKGFRDFLLTVFGDIAKFQTKVWQWIADLILEALIKISEGVGHFSKFFGFSMDGVVSKLKEAKGWVDNLAGSIQNLDFVAAGDSLFNSLTNALKVPSAPAFNAGASLGSNFNAGTQKGLKGAGASTKKTMAEIQDSVNKAIDTYKSSLVQKFAAVGSVINNDVQGPAGTFGLIGNLSDQLAKAKQFAVDIATLRKRGLNAAALNELINAGPEQGGTAARDLAQSSNSQLAAVNSLESQIQGAANSYANTQVKADFKSKPGIGKNVVNLNLDLSGVSNDALVKALRQAIRVKGGNVQVVLGGAA